jgi:hypothetical protein
MANAREDSESLDEILDPHREEEREAAAMELSGRLAQKGIEVGSDEDPGQLADLLSAVEEFERAVEKGRRRFVREQPRVIGAAGIAIRSASTEGMTSRCSGTVSELSQPERNSLATNRVSVTGYR